MQTSLVIERLQSLRTLTPSASERLIEKSAAQQETMAVDLQRQGVDVGQINQAVTGMRLDLHSTPVIEGSAEATEIVKKYAANTAMTFRETYFQAFKGLDALKLGKGTAILAVVYLLQRFSIEVLQRVLLRAGMRGPAVMKISLLLLIVVIAPLTEEYGRRLSRRVGAGAGFSVVLNVFEFVGYTRMMTSKGVPLIGAVVSRLIAAFAMHKVAETIQQYFHNQSELKDKPGLAAAGFWLAVGFHMIWNLVGAMSMDLKAFTEDTEVDERLAELELL